ncbi:MAG: MFS transporter [Chloroflexota bacterium]|nr:MFS transporter [Chloroflexota bacterium]
MAEGKRPKIFYGYIVVIAAVFVMAVMWGILYSFGVFFKSVLNEFGWTSAATSGAYSLCFFLLGLSSIVTGRLTDILGPRKIVTICGVLFAAGFLLMSRVSAIWQFYLFYGVLVGMGIAGSYVPLVSTTARWFVKRRGLMIGIVASGVGIGTVIIPPLAAQLILRYGWRESYLIVGAVALVLILAAAQFLRRDPAQVGQLPYGVDEVEAENLNLSVSGLTVRQALGTRQFWLIWVAVLTAGFCIQSVLVHVVPDATGNGIPVVAAATILTAIGVFNTASRVIMGSAADRIGAKRTVVIAAVLMSVGLFYLAGIKQLWMFYLFTALFGFAYGGFLALLSPVAAEIFGLRAQGALLGLIHFGLSMGETVGPVVTGGIFDMTGSYRSAFLIGGGIMAVGIVLLLLVRPAIGLGGENDT